MSRDKLVYHPLGNDQIRLFRLLRPVNFRGEIEGQLVIVDAIRPGLYYTTLSYAWGPSYADGSHLTESILCDGCEFRVTPNLKQALWRMRDLEPNICHDYIWIDFICINQEDVQERSEQVSKMAEIYHQASTLIVWLGELDPGPAGYRQYELLGGFDLSDRMPRQSGGRLASGPDAWPGKRQMGVASSRTQYIQWSTDLPALKLIIERGWFMRRWVIQEVAATDPHDAYFLIGDAVCPREDFDEILRSLNLLRLAPALQNHPRGLSVLQTLYMFDLSECSDPRDRVFALKDLSPRGRGMLADYNSDVRETYLNLVKTDALGVKNDAGTMMRQRGGAASSNIAIPDEAEALRMLALATCKKYPVQEQLAMEAWMPDWRIKARYESEAHQSAVAYCMEESLDDQGSLSMILAEARNGYVYLRLQGDLLKPSFQNSMSSLKRVVGMKPQWLGKLEDFCRPHWPRPTLRTDRIWLTPGRFQGGYALAFVLRTTFAATPEFQGRPIYRLRSCFLISDDSGKRSIPTSPDARNAIRERVSASLALSEAFCLE